MLPKFFLKKIIYTIDIFHIQITFKHTSQSLECRLGDQFSLFTAAIQIARLVGFTGKLFNENPFSDLLVQPYAEQPTIVQYSALNTKIFQLLVKNKTNQIHLKNFQAVYFLINCEQNFGKFIKK